MAVEAAAVALGASGTSPNHEPIMNERTGSTGANKPGLLTLASRTRARFTSPTCPVKNGGLFIPTNSNYRISNECSCC